MTSLIATPSRSELPVLSEIRAAPIARVIARLTFIVLIGSPAILGFVPWQQNVAGDGRIIAYAPLERRQIIDARIDGRIAHWWVVEGSRVKKGERLLEIVDNDPDYVKRLGEQLAATKLKLSAADMKAEAYRTQIRAFEEAGAMAADAAQNYVQMAGQKIKAYEQEVGAAKIAADTDRLNVERISILYKEGLASKRDSEVAEQKVQESVAKFRKAQADFDGSKNEELAKRADLVKVRAEASTKVETARAYYQEAMGEAALARKELAEADVKLSRQATQVLYAPRDGTILRLLANQDAELVKAGDPLLELVPDTESRAVELWVDGNDAPLIDAGRHVRLQFEGWPAVQFAGWPSVAVGTFGGKVILVDSTDNGKGKFRILVIPEEAEEWPAGRYLRQGVRAKGWVLLNQVSLGFEFWRRLNGFPPAVAESEPGEKDEKVKVKRPK